MLSAEILGDLDPRPLRRVEYEQLVASGAFEDERVELLYGVMTRMNAKGPTHDAVIQRLTRVLARVLGERADLRVQCAFAASDESEPEPDLAVVTPGDYDDAHPHVAHLIIEVAESSLKKDRAKARIYAESGVPEYWVVNLTDKIVEVYTSIRSGAYTRITPYDVGGSIDLVAFPGVMVSVAQVLR